MSRLSLTRLIFVLSVFLLLVLGSKIGCFRVESKKIQVSPPPINKPEVPHKKISITTVVPNYLGYEEIINQLNEWHEEAGSITEVGVLGKTTKNKDIYYFKISRKNATAELPKVLVTACIHGNEPWSTGCIMAYIGNLLADYDRNQSIKEIIDSRELYFVPVVSPDSYPNSRIVDNVDPNRNFPTPDNQNHISIKPIKELQDFFYKINPDAVFSGHTFGRVYLTPYGDNKDLCPNNSEYEDIVGRMAKLSNYKYKRCCFLYSKPIKGSEIDWYYRNGALSIVAEFGIHQQRPSHEQIVQEFNRTWEAFKLFIKEAPLIQMKAGSEYKATSEINAGLEADYYLYQRSLPKAQ